MNTSNVVLGSARGAVRLAALALAAGAFASVVSVAMAQNGVERELQPTVTVQAPRVVQHRIVGSSGISAEQLSLTREVSFADLNLDTPQGKAALHERIRDNARQACRQLAALYPLLIWTDDVETCVQNAMLTWMPQVHAVALR